MVLFVPCEFLPCAYVPLDNGDDRVVYRDPAIHNAVFSTSISLQLKTGSENMSIVSDGGITSFIVGKSNPSPMNDLATSMFLLLIVNLAAGWALE